MSQESSDKTSKHLPAIKTFSAVAGASAEWLLDLSGVNGLVGSIFGATLTVGAETVLSGNLSRRERWSVETVVRRAIERAAERCTDGEMPRQDDFVSGTPSSFEELVEGALMTAQRNYESRKLEYLGNLVSSFGFDTSIDSTTANWCIRMAESLSWAQYVLLTLANEDEAEYPRAHLTGGRDRAVDEPTTLSVWEEWEDLYARRLVSVDPDESRNIEGATPRRMSYIPTHGGRLLIRLMELDSIAAGDRDLIYGALLKGILGRK